MASLRMIRPGLHTTVQDMGRWGWQAHGVPVAGAMDLSAYRVANALAGNEPGTSALEVTLVGPEIEFDDRRVLAVSGAVFDLRLDGRPLPMNTAAAASAGSTLAFGARREGARAYLAVSGGFDVPEVFGSRSTHVASRMGGFDGRALKSGDRLPLGPAGGVAPDVRGVDAAIAAFDRAPCVRVLPGPHDHRFQADAFAALQAGHYTIGSNSDRMGFHLSGPPIRHARDAQMISDATTVGALQVPASCQPVLLMADRPTTGGYPIVATVISADISRVAQLAPGDSVSFTICTGSEALTLAIDAERRLLAFESGR